MRRHEKVLAIRKKLMAGIPSIGSWMQIPHGSVAEIMGCAGLDWVAVDMEHGSISVDHLPDIFRGIDRRSTAPLARVAQASEKDCKQALDSGAAGLIVPKIESLQQFENVVNYSCWPPVGKRGVGFSRANMFGAEFDEYTREATSPFLVAMIETLAGVNHLHHIVTSPYLDAVFIGPYDLSASCGDSGNFQSAKYLDAVCTIETICKDAGVPLGIHVVAPSKDLLNQQIQNGYQFIAYSIDAVMLAHEISGLIKE